MKASHRILLYLVLLLATPILIIGCVVSQPILSHNDPSAVTVDPERLAAHVSVLSEQYSPRSYEYHENLGKCADYIRRQFAEMGGMLSNQLYDIYGTTYENVILTFPGIDTTRVVVGAHYDACGDTPGADDNASAVAGLIELARLLADVELQHTVELIAYCTEEPPYFATDHMGSAHHAAMLREQGVEVRAMIALEMIGYFSDEKGSQQYPMALLRLFYPSRGNFIGVVGNTKQRELTRRIKRSMRGATDLPVRSISIPSFVPGVDFSDHRSFWAQGFPAVMITDTAFYRNKMYHGDGDTADRLDYERMSQVVVGVFEAVTGLAKSRSVEASR